MTHSEGPARVGDGVRVDDVVVLVPVFNEAQVLEPVLRGLRSVFPHVVVVDDGSLDGSHLIALRCGATVLRHAVNLGAGAALQTGLDHVLTRPACHWVITFDGDGQHDPADALAMLRVARADGLDVVLGSRTIGRTSGQHWARRLLLAAAVRFTRWSTGLPVTDTHNGLRVLSRNAAQRIRLTHAGMAYASEVEETVARHGLLWREHPVTIAYTDYSRAKGQPNVNSINVLYDLFSARLRSRP